MRVLFYVPAGGRSPVERHILALPKADQAKYADVITGIEAHGLDFEPVRFRHLQGKLWELKFRSPGGDHRVAYVMVAADAMVWLHAFKKDSQRTPREDLALALKRMKEVQ